MNVCTLVVVCVLLSYMYLLYYVCIAVFTYMPDCWLEVSIRKVLRPAISTQVFLGFRVPKANAEMVPKIRSGQYMLLM